MFRSCLRFEPNWIKVQTPPSTVCASRTDPLLVHDRSQEYMSAAENLARIYRESIMDIMYVYRFSSDVDIFCRFDSSSSQYHTPLSKKQHKSSYDSWYTAYVDYSSKNYVHQTNQHFIDVILFVINVLTNKWQKPVHYTSSAIMIHATHDQC